MTLLSRATVGSPYGTAKSGATLGSILVGPIIMAVCALLSRQNAVCTARSECSQSFTRFQGSQILVVLDSDHKGFANLFEDGAHRTLGSPVRTMLLSSYCYSSNNTHRSDLTRCIDRVPGLVSNQPHNITLCPLASLALNDTASTLSGKLSAVKKDVIIELVEILFAYKHLIEADPMAVTVKDGTTTEFVLLSALLVLHFLLLLIRISNAQEFRSYLDQKPRPDWPTVIKGLYY